MEKIHLKKCNEYALSIGNADFLFFWDRGTVVEDRMMNSVYHTHAYNEVFYVLKGSININTEEKNYSLNTGDAAIVFAGTPHFSSGGEGAGRIAVCFNVSRKNKTNEPRYFEQFERLAGKGGVEVVRGIEDMGVFKRLEYYERSAYADKKELIAASLREMILLVKAAIDDGAPENSPIMFDSNDSRYYLIDRYFTGHFAGITLKELSGILHLSIQQTQRIIKKLYGQSFRERVVYVKMRHARDLLKNTSLPVTDIAGEVGYTAVHGFFTAFKKEYGITPKEYRDSINR